MTPQQLRGHVSRLEGAEEFFYHVMDVLAMMAKRVVMRIDAE